MKTEVRNTSKKVSNVITTKKATKKATEKATTKKATEKKAVKVTKLERLNKAISKAQSESANAWDKLGGASAQTQLDMFSLSKIASIFCKSEFIDDIQRKLLSFANIQTFVKESAKFKDKVLFNTNDVKLICNSILKAKDTRVQIALKVTKQGGTIKQK